MLPKKIYIVAAAFLGVTLCASYVGFWILRVLPISSDPVLPRELNALAGQKVGTYLRRIADVPPSVVEAAKKVVGTGSFEMADAGRPWNATDFVVDRSLPFRRMIWAVSVDDHFILHYEMGGIGHSWHVLVFGPTRNGRRECIWSGSAEHSFISIYTFAHGVANGSIISHPALMH